MRLVSYKKISLVCLGQSLLEDSNIRGEEQYQDQGHRVEEYSRDMRRSRSIPASGWKFNRHSS